MSIVCGFRSLRLSGKILLSWFCMSKIELRVHLGQVVSFWTNCTLIFDMKQTCNKGLCHGKVAHFKMDNLYNWKSLTVRCSVCLNCQQIILLCRAPQYPLEIGKVQLETRDPFQQVHIYKLAWGWRFMFFLETTLEKKHVSWATISGNLP